MQKFRAGVFYGWRRPVGWLTSYALVLQLVAAALAGGALSAQAAEQNWSYFEICYGQGASDGQLPDGAPAKHNSKCASCVLAAAGGVALATEAAMVAAPAFVVTSAVWIQREQHLARSAYSLSQRQRAPPIAA